MSVVQCKACGRARVREAGIVNATQSQQLPPPQTVLE